MLGVLLSRGLDENAEILVFVRAVATTLLAAVVAKLLGVPERCAGAGSDLGTAGSDLFSELARSTSRVGP